MKFNVGYPQTRNDRFVSKIIEHAGAISEVYFSFGGIPNGRSPNVGDEFPLDAQLRQLDDLKSIARAGIKLDLLLNANCYGEDSLARAFYMRLGDTVDFLCGRVGLSVVTTTSPLIAKFLHANFDLDVRASVNIGVGSPQALDQVSDYFDSFYIKRELNRDLKALKRVKSWCDANSKKLFILANSGCTNDCPAHDFHDNLVAHEAEISKRDNAYQFTGLCKERLQKPEKRFTIVRDMNYIRPEDIHLYEGLCESMKLATRVNPNPGRLLDAYLDGVYRGAVTDLLEPDNGAAMRPVIVDNSRFPKDFGERVATCGKDCENCDYCRSVYEQAKAELVEI